MDTDEVVLAAFKERSHHDGTSLIDLLANASGDQNMSARSRREYRDMGEAILKSLQDREILERDHRGWWVLRAGVVPLRGPALK